MRWSARALDLVIARCRAARVTRAGASRSLALRDPARVAAATRSTARRASARTARPFEIYKLRTMVHGAEFTGAGLAIHEGDDRITRVGAFLRRTSLDELPNLWNVLRGEMSIIGPRPTLQVQVDQYTERQRGRLAVKPGITGWAQVNGRASLPWSERIELDLWYVEHRSLALDLEILARTVRMVVTGAGPLQGRDGRMACTT